MASPAFQLNKRLKMLHAPSARAVSKISPENVIPLHWSDYFDRCETVSTEDGQFRVYVSGTSGPLLVCLHGAGCSALTWAVFSKAITRQIECTLVAIDLRGHGDTIVTDEYDLSMPTLVGDVNAVIESMYPDLGSCILIGHSMGGAVATHVASVPSPLSSRVTALIVIDVVEGSAIENLTYMKNILKARPTGFASLKDAIMWSASRCSTTDFTALRVAMPGQLKCIATDLPATNNVLEEINEFKPEGKLGPADASEEGSEVETSGSFKCPLDGLTIKEEITEKSAPRPPKSSPPLPLFVRRAQRLIDGPSRAGLPSIPQGITISPSTMNPCNNPPANKSNKYTWRIDLFKTKPHWEQWFTGMSDLFLNCSALKLLVLCNTDRLDTKLLTGQMQGKFQQALLKCSHQIQEDKPEELSEKISAFLIRHKICQAMSEVVG